MEPTKTTHPAMERAYAAAIRLGLIGPVRRQSALARLLNTSSQAVKNWEERGPSKEFRLTLQSRFGINASWIETGEGDALLPSSNSKADDGEAQSPAAAQPTVADLLERLRAEISTQPEAVKRAIAELMAEYVTTPDEATGRAVADAILRILGPRP